MVMWKQESLPAWPQEAYCPSRSKYLQLLFCLRWGSTPVLSQLGGGGTPVLSWLRSTKVLSWLGGTPVLSWPRVYPRPGVSPWLGLGCPLARTGGYPCQKSPGTSDLGKNLALGYPLPLKWTWERTWDWGTLCPWKGPGKEPETGVPQKRPGIRDLEKNLGLGCPPCGQTDWRLWKHYLPVVLRTRVVIILYLMWR